MEADKAANGATELATKSAGKDSPNDTAPGLDAAEFMRLADSALATIEHAASEAECDLDADFVSAGVLEIEFADGAQMIVNRHEASRELWVAGRSGAHHFRWDGQRWVDTRSGDELFDLVSAMASRMAGCTVRLG